MAVVLGRKDTRFGAKILIYTHQAIDRSHLMEAYCTWLHPYTFYGSQLARHTMVQAPSWPWVLQENPLLRDRAESIDTTICLQS
jgi:hypothetical protein